MASVELSRYEAEQGELPDVCVQCGEPAVCKRAKLFAWWPVWLYLLLFCYIIPMFLAAAVLGRFMRVKLPFCASHRNAWFRRSRLFWCGLGVSGIVGLILSLTNEEQVGGGSAKLVLWSLGGVILLAWLVALSTFGRSNVSAKIVKRDSIVLRRVSPAFIDAMHEFRELHPDVAFQAPESLVPRLVMLGVVVCCTLLVCLPLAIFLLEANIKATKGANRPVNSKD